MKKYTLPNNFVPLQKWEGCVLELRENSFIARLVDLTEKGPEEEAEFPLSKVSEDDHELVSPGAIFYWDIGYYDDSHHDLQKGVSIIRFRHEPVWSAKEIEEAKRKAERIRKVLNWG